MVSTVTVREPQVSATLEPVALPDPRGPVTEFLFGTLRRRSANVSGGQLPHEALDVEDPLGNEDLQLALYCCYELCYQGLPGVSDYWEWDPLVLDLRRRLEASFEAQLRDELPGGPVGPGEVPEALWAMTRGDGRSLSGWLVEHGTRFHAEELAVHRSAYQLKEADPHTWALPRLTGRAKAAMVDIQASEYGHGVVSEMHSSLFGDAMVALGLDPRYGSYLDKLPAPTLATTNLISLLGLHRRLRGALIGHLALFEMTSIGPMARYTAWLRSLGVPAAGRRFYDVHVEADEVHQHVAVEDLVGGLLETEPGQGSAVLFGADALRLVESRFTAHVLDRWSRERSSLFELAPPLAPGPP